MLSSTIAGALQAWVRTVHQSVAVGKALAQENRP
jgi:hypothetical protein